MSSLPASLPWIEKLVSYPTIAQTPNTELIEAVAVEFEKRGFTPWYTASEGGQRKNLFVTLPAHDGTTSGGLVLSGHTDVVPVEGQAWDTDPFSATVKADKLYGRGVADMKSYLAAALWMLPRFAEADRKRPLHFAFTYDEEIGCVGAPSMIAELKKRGVLPDFAIVGEPSSMHPIVAHKGAHRGRATFRGVAKHGSLAPYGVNAVAAAAKFVAFIEDMADDWLENGPFDEGFVTPTSTAGANFMRGGLQYNIVGEEATVEYDFRTIPAMTTQDVVARLERKLFDDLLPELKAKAERAERLSGAEPGSLREQISIEHELLAEVPALQERPDDEIVALGARLVGKPEVLEADPIKVTYGTEAGQYQQAGMGAIVCGPGDIAQAHTANEWIELEQVRECERFMERVLEWVQA